MGGPGFGLCLKGLRLRRPSLRSLRRPLDGAYGYYSWPRWLLRIIEVETSCVVPLCSYDECGFRITEKRELLSEVSTVSLISFGACCSSMNCCNFTYAGDGTAHLVHITIWAYYPTQCPAWVGVRPVLVV